MATFPMASQIDLCIVCSRRVLQHMRRLYCNCCHRNVHKNCTGLWGEDFEIATQDTSWYCVTCMESLFAFNHFDDETDFLKAIADMSHQEASVQLGLRSKLFNPFEINEDEHEILDYQGDLDPDKYYFNQYSHRLIKNCNYFLEESFKIHLSHHHISNEAFSMLHLNIRSIPANLPAFQSYLDILDHHFSIVGLTETWLKPSNISAYGIGGYNHVGITRQNTKGGGISLFLSQEIVY